MNIISKIRHMFKPMLSCEQVNGFILDYLEGRLPDETKNKFESHLQMCAACTPYLEQYKQTVDIVAKDGKIDVPADLAEHTMSFLRENLPNIK